MIPSSSIDRKRLVQLNSIGVFPFEEEEESAYVNRTDPIDISLHKGIFGFSYLFDRNPLCFYESACTLTDQSKARVVVHPRFEKKKKWLGISLEEILEHETVHYLRRGFKGDRYEEVLAYFRSKSPLRRWIGPMFQNSRESLFFVFFTLMLPASVWMDWFFYPFFSYGILNLFFITRGVFRRVQVVQVLKKLSQLTDQSAFDCLLRLTASEIDQFSHWPIEKIASYLSYPHASIRIQQIAESYLKR